MKIGSLFAGIGGLELGLERAGVGHTVWQVERDPFCQKVLARHWPDATRYDDVTTVDWSTVEPVEVICGGFPCQDLSYAGKGAGLAGARSGLWREYVRAIRGVRPQFVVVENVPALLARGLDIVLGDLAACGYDAEWDCIPAAAVGAPHRRDRVFLVAYPDGDGQPVEPVDGDTGQRVVVPRLVADADGGGHGPQQDARRVGRVDGEDARRPRERQQPRSEPGRGSEAVDVGDPDGMARKAPGPCDGQPEPMARPGEVERTIRSGGSDGHTWATEPDVGRVADGVPARVDRLRALGNAVVPQVAEVVGRRLMELAS